MAPVPARVDIHLRVDGSAVVLPLMEFNGWLFQKKESALLLASRLHFLAESFEGFNCRADSRVDDSVVDHCPVLV